MKQDTRTLERAFELARWGGCRTIGEITKELTREGYYADEIFGRALAAKLRSLMAEASGQPQTTGP